MNELNNNQIPDTQTIKLENITEQIVIDNPGHPFVKTVKNISEKGNHIYTNVFQYGLSASVITKSILTASEQVGVLSTQKYESIMRALPSLQHVTNIGASYAMIGTSVAAGEFVSGVLAATGHNKAAKYADKAMPVMGAVAAVGVQLYVESRKIVPWDTLDNKDALLGIAFIVPGYIAARHFVTHDLKIKEAGISFYGKIKKKIGSPESVVETSDIDVVEINNTFEE